MCLPKHPNCERKFKVGVGNGDILIENALDSLLLPRTILAERV